MIDVENRDGVAVLTMRHGKVNAFDVPFLAELGRQLDELEGSAARAVVLTGAGSIFSAGVNLFAVLEGGPSYLEEFLPALSSGIRRALLFPKPIVAAVNGHALAGGCVLAAACDARVMAEGNGTIGMTELLVGVPFPSMAFEVMRALLSAHDLQELIYRGTALRPEQAKERGLVDAVVPADSLMEAACDRARALGAIPSRTFAATKRQLRRPVVEAVDRHGAAMDREVLGLWSDASIQANIRAFLDRTLKKP